MSKDNINPDHYISDAIECIDAIKASMSAEQFRGHLKACCMKYLWRYENKNGVEDLKKARWYLDKLIQINSI
tara:strand:- start:450 stop:665 length:216 start_codon:yes stop_codon:yes gene_type:complete